MTASERLDELRNMQADILCISAANALEILVDVMNKETVLLRAGQYKEAADLSAQKGQVAQDYVVLARAVQHEAPRLRQQAPDNLQELQDGHEKLATQMAENLRVLATARTVTQDLLADVSDAVGGQSRSSTYSASGQMSQSTPDNAARGIAVNQSL